MARKKKRPHGFGDGFDDGVAGLSEAGGRGHRPRLQGGPRLQAGPRRRTGRWKRRLVVFLLLICAFVAALPWLVAKTPLRDVLVAAAVPSDQLRVTVGDASLGWFSEPVLSQVEIRDAAGEPLLTIESIRVRRTPLALASNWRDLGEIEIERPVVYLAVRPDGSNIEDAIDQLLGNDDQIARDEVATADSDSTEVAVRVVDGTIFAADTATGRRWRISRLNVEYDARGAGLGPFSVAGQIETAEVNADGTVSAVPAGRFSVSLVTADDGRQQLNWQAEGLSLGIAGPWVGRFVAGAELGGTLSGQATATWSTTAAQPTNPHLNAISFPPDLATSGSLRIDGLDATAPALLGDRVRLAQVELPWQLTARPQGIVIENLELRSDVGQVAAHGTIDPTTLAALAGGDATQFGATSRDDVEVHGEVDLARLAAMLPHALRIRDDTSITSGTIHLAVRSQPLDGGQSLSGMIRTAGLAATSGGRPIRWDQPVSVAFDLRRDNGATRLESLRCDSEFLRVDAAGTATQLTANANFDLNRLATELGQFVDLSGVELAGTGTAHVDWHQTGADQFVASANSELSQLRVALGDGSVWIEPRLVIKCEAAGNFDPTTRQPTRVTTAGLQVEAENDRLDVRLTGPADLTAAPSWPLSIHATGSIARWLARVRPWFAPGTWQVDGRSELVADARVSASAVEIANAKLTIENLQAQSDGWSIQEPRLELAGDARWDGVTGEVASQSAQLVTSTVAVAARDVRARLGGEGLLPQAQVTGAAAFRVDLARLASWRSGPRQTPTYHPQGMLTGNLRFSQQADRITGELTANGENLALTASRAAPVPGPADYETIWQEPRLSIRGTAAYEPTADRLTFQQIQVQSNTLQATIAGGIDKLTTTADVNVAGTVNYDLAQLTLLLRPYVGEGVQLAGRDEARFQIAGALGGSQERVAGVEPTQHPARRAPSRTLGRRAPSTLTNWGLAQGSTPATHESAIHWSRRIHARFEAPWSSANVYGLPIGGGKIVAVLGDGAVRVEPLAIAVAEGQLTAAPYVRLDPQPGELTLPKGPVLTKVNISPEVSEAMLKYVAPVLAGATESEGKFSLQLEGARVPLDEPKRADVAGQLTVHAVRVVPGPLAKEWIGLAQQIEAIAKRRDPTALAQRPNVTLLTIQDQQVNFRLVDGRVYHQNMEFQIDDLTLRSEGSVGLDETLALVLHVPIQDNWLGGDRLLAGLKGQTVKIPVSGTLSRPRMDRSAVASLSKQLLQGAAQQAIQGELNRALDKLFKPR